MTTKTHEQRQHRSERRLTDKKIIADYVADTFEIPVEKMFKGAMQEAWKEAMVIGTTLDGELLVFGSAGTPTHKGNAELFLARLARGYYGSKRK